MEDILEVFNWFYDNRTWLFSGIGVTVIIAIYHKWCKKRKDSTEKVVIQQSGANNTQIGIQNNYYGTKDN